MYEYFTVCQHETVDKCMKNCRQVHSSRERRFTPMTLNNTWEGYGVNKQFAHDVIPKCTPQQLTRRPEHEASFGSSPADFKINNHSITFRNIDFSW